MIKQGIHIINVHLTLRFEFISIQGILLIFFKKKQACEQLNAWLGGFQPILNRMTPGNFNWFLHSLLFLHTERVIEAQKEKKQRQDRTDDDENENEGENEDAHIGIDIDRE
jgi:hypothetical protein